MNRKAKWLFGVVLPALLWLAGCGERPSPRGGMPAEDPQLPEQEQQQYLARGGELAAITFSAMSTRLQQALAEGGVPHALQYCNTVAYPLVDSLSAVHQALIRRTSLRVRNPKNKPADAEREILMEYQRLASAGEPLTPRVISMAETGEIAFFAPILVQELCLTCHGKTGADLSEENAQLIRSLYPEDEATGYIAGDLRGMWSIRFRTQ